MATSTYTPSATTTAFAEMTAPHREHSMTHGSEEFASNLKQINVGDWERWFSLAAGSGLAFYGLTRGTLGGLGWALAGAALTVRGVTGHCHVYEALGINTAEPHGPRASIAAGHGVKVERSITVERPRREVFRFWRDFSNLPRVMSNLESVTIIGPNRSHWVAKGPLGNVEWDAETITERENELIGWRSLEGSTVDTAGSVHFEDTYPGGGTEVKVVLKYDPPAGKVGATVASWLGEDPEKQIDEDLQRFKETMENSGAARKRSSARRR